MILMIDNYDSFTYNLAQYLSELGHAVDVVRHDAITIADIITCKPSHIVISPGPCTPNEAGISMSVIKYFAGIIPLLGVCLGHQCIAQAFGGKIIHANNIMHGKLSIIHHRQQGIFRRLAKNFNATRYHSLVVDKHSLPDCFEMTAWTEDEAGNTDEIMAIKHKQFAIEGIQFHPESILTEHGHRLLNNFLMLYPLHFKARDSSRRHPRA